MELLTLVYVRKWNVRENRRSAQDVHACVLSAGVGLTAGVGARQGVRNKERRTVFETTFPSTSFQNVERRDLQSLESNAIWVVR